MKIVFRNFNQNTLLFTIVLMVAGLVNILTMKKIIGSDSTPGSKKNQTYYFIFLMQIFLIIYGTYELIKAGAI